MATKSPYYKPLSMSLTLLWEGERVGRVEVTGRHTHFPMVAGNYFPTPDCAERTPTLC